MIHDAAKAQEESGHGHDGHLHDGHSAWVELGNAFHQHPIGQKAEGLFWTFWNILKHFEVHFLNIFFFRKATVIAIARLAQLPAVLNLNMSIIVHRHQPVIFSGWETHWRPWNRKCATARGGREPNLTWEMLSWLRCLSTNEGTPQTAKGNGNLRINLDLWVQYSQT